MGEEEDFWRNVVERNKGTNPPKTGLKRVSLEEYKKRFDMTKDDINEGLDD